MRVDIELYSHTFNVLCVLKHVYTSQLQPAAAISLPYLRHGVGSFWKYQKTEHINTTLALVKASTFTGIHITVIAPQHRYNFDYTFQVLYSLNLDQSTRTENTKHVTRTYDATSLPPSCFP
jgi:hypothetical protein